MRCGLDASELILLLGADRAVQGPVRRACDELGLEVVCADNLDEAATIVRDRSPCLVLCDFETFEEVRHEWPRSSVVLISGSANSEQAIEGMKRGALDYVLKPFDHEDMVRRIGNAVRISRDVNVPAVYESRQDDTHVERIVGRSPAMQEVYKLIGLVAPRDVNVLITGESGTGKELVARAIYHHSLRREKPFLAVNCAAIPDTLLESELFGHEKGAFTGAETRRMGKFEQCDEGTLFLDEIGDIPLTTQAKLLRVLQDNSFQRLGGTEVVRCDVRIIAATNQPLEQLLEERQFREDLYYRLKVASIDVPPLREREVDVVLLAHAFVKRLNPQLGTNVGPFSPEVLPVLLAYPWPGNVRELENVIRSSLVVARGPVFRLEYLPEHIRQASASDAIKGAPRTESGGLTVLPQDLRRFAETLAANPDLEGSLHSEAVASAEREIIRACLERANGVLGRAAGLLGISRTTLRKKLAQYGIRIDTQVRMKE